MSKQKVDVVKEEATPDTDVKLFTDEFLEKRVDKPLLFARVLAATFTPSALAIEITEEGTEVEVKTTYWFPNTLTVALSKSTAIVDDYVEEEAKGKDDTEFPLMRHEEEDVKRFREKQDQS